MKSFCPCGPVHISKDVWLKTPCFSLPPQDPYGFQFLPTLHHQTTSKNQLLKKLKNTDTWDVLTLFMLLFDSTLLLFLCSFQLSHLILIFYNSS